MMLHVNTCSDGLEPAGNHRAARLRCSATAVPAARARVRSGQRSLFPNGPGVTDLYRCSPGTAGTAVPDGRHTHLGYAHAGQRE